MKALVIAAVLSVASVATAEPKPVLCIHYTLGSYLADEGKVTLAVCVDGKKPIVLSRPVEVRFLSADGTPIMAVIGWRQ